MDSMDWVDSVKTGDYFEIKEGDNKIQLLTHAAPLRLKWTGQKYEPAEEGDSNISIKGVCWVLQDGNVKLAKLPYTVVKAVRELQKDEEYGFDDFPMNRAINIKAKGAGTKEVEYNVVPSAKESPVPSEVLAILKTKKTPEAIVDEERGRGKHAPEIEDIDPSEIPF